jgi:hypothetical protein
MRFLAPLLALSTCLLGGCAVFMHGAAMLGTTPAALAPRRGGRNPGWETAPG